MSEKVLSPARHEPTDVGERFIWIGVAWLLASVLVLGAAGSVAVPGCHDRPDHALAAPALPQSPTPAEPARGHGEVLREEMRWLERDRLDRQGARHRAHPDFRCDAAGRARRHPGLAGADGEAPMRLRLLLRAAARCAARSRLPASLPDFSGLAYEQKLGSRLPLQAGAPRRDRAQRAAVRLVRRKAVDPGARIFPLPQSVQRRARRPVRCAPRVRNDGRPRLRAGRLEHRSVGDERGRDGGQGG